MSISCALRAAPLVALLSMTSCGGARPAQRADTSPPTAPPATASPSAEGQTAASLDQPGRHVFFIAPQREECSGEGITECLSVAPQATGPFSRFYGGIQGFTFTPGFAYELDVEVAMRPPPIPEDASDRTYRLVREIRRTPAPAPTR